MELNHDQVRLFLLSVEATQDIHGMDDDIAIEWANSLQISRNQLAYIVIRLKEAEFITGEVNWASNKPYRIYPGNLTYKGHEFLDNIRDDGVWKNTKAILGKMSSSSLTLCGKIAEGVIMNLISRQMGQS